MNPFEKIFNYQLLSRLDDSGVSVTTSQERSWLKSMLAHPAAGEAFTSSALQKLERILEDDPVMDTGDLIEKARSRDKQTYHPLLPPLLRHIRNKDGLRLTYEVKSGDVRANRWVLPYKLEYSMVKREWYLLWYPLPSNNRQLHCVRLSRIHSVEVEPISQKRADELLGYIQRRLHSRTRRVGLEIVPMYNGELSRILYALSSFEKEVVYDEAADTYRVNIFLPADEFEYLLSKLRFLGKRVRIVQGDYLLRRMKETAAMALGRYGVSASAPEKSAETGDGGACGGEGTDAASG